MFKSLDEIKAVAEKFEAGKIVPRRVLKVEGKGERRARSNLIFTRTMYRVLGKNNVHVFLCDFKENSSDVHYCIELKGTHHNLDLCGSSHGKTGNHFIGNLGVDDGECLKLFNHSVFGKLAVEL